nr:LysR family transcriptional regulator [Thermomonas flagellata]
MHLTLRQLQVFEATVRLGGYTRAAEVLHMTQPAVSMHIRLLEEQAGVPLIDRVGKKMHLTDAGHALYRHAQGVLARVREAEGELEDLRGLRRGQLNITIASTANYFAPRLLAAFRRRYPDIRIDLDVSNRERILELLETSDKDLAIMGQPPASADLVAHPFLDNPLVVIAAPSHPLAGQTAIGLERLAQEAFISREPGSGTRMAAERFFEAAGLCLTVDMQMSSNEAIKQAVEAGLGFGVISAHTLELELALGRLVVLDVQGFPIRRQWYVAHRTGKRFSTVADAFLRFVLEEARGLLGTPPLSARTSPAASPGCRTRTPPRNARRRTPRSPPAADPPSPRAPRRAPSPARRPR